MAKLFHRISVKPWLRVSEGFPSSWLERVDAVGRGGWAVFW